MGDRNRFALGFELLEDPDPGPWLLRKSWGRLQIWVAGRNLTLGRTKSEETATASEVPLLPILQWLADNWDPALHEERLPRPNKALSAASWRIDILAHLPSAPAQFDQLLKDREDFWHRHGLGSSLPGFRIPDLHLRRRGGDIELSWDDREWRSVPSGVLLVERPGYALLPAPSVADVLMDFSSALLVALTDGAAAVPCALAHLDALRAQFAAHRNTARHIERLRWMAGVDIVAAAHRLRSMAGIVGGAVDDTVRALLGLESLQAPALVTHATLPALLFRSAAPSLSADDLNVLIRLAREADGPTRPALASLRSPAPLPGSEAAITSDGLDRALQLRQALGLPPDAPLRGEHDLETVLLARLGVDIKTIHLDDTGVDGIALGGPTIAPTIALNLSGRRSSTAWGRRMTLAHELCHLLFDVDAAGRVGIVSNRWADAGVERRANAFAVALLAPEQALQAILDRRTIDQWTRSDVGTAMARLGIGVTTLTWQLKNLGWIDATTQEYWLETFRPS